MAVPPNPFAGLGGDDDNPFAGLGQGPLEEASQPGAAPESSSWWNRIFTAPEVVMKPIRAAGEFIRGEAKKESENPFKAIGAVAAFSNPALIVPAAMARFGMETAEQGSPVAAAQAMAQTDLEAGASGFLSPGNLALMLIGHVSGQQAKAVADAGSKVRALAQALGDSSQGPATAKALLEELRAAEQVFGKAKFWSNLGATVEGLTGTAMAGHGVGTAAEGVKEKNLGKVVSGLFEIGMGGIGAAAGKGRFLPGGPPGPGRPRKFFEGGASGDEQLGPPKPAEVPGGSPFEGLGEVEGVNAGGGEGGAAAAGEPGAAGAVGAAGAEPAPVVPATSPKPTTVTAPRIAADGFPEVVAPRPFDHLFGDTSTSLPEHIAPSILPLATDAIDDPALRILAEDTAQKWSQQPRLGGERSLAHAPELAPHRAEISQLAEDIRGARQFGRAVLRSIQNEPAAPEAPAPAKLAAELPNGVWQYDVIPGTTRVLQVHQGKIVAAAEADGGQLKMITGGKEMGSPVSIRPLFEYVRARFEPDIAVTTLGELTRRRKIRSYVEEVRRNAPPAAEGQAAPAEYNPVGGEVRPTDAEARVAQGGEPAGGGADANAPPLPGGVGGEAPGPVAAAAGGVARGGAEEGLGGAAEVGAPPGPESRSGQTVGALALAEGGGEAPPPTPPPPGGPPGPSEPPRPPGFAGQVVAASSRVQKIADSFKALAEKFSIASKEAENIAELGTIGEEGLSPTARDALRERFRAAGQPSAELTHTLRTSAADIERAGAELVATHRELVRLGREANATQDPDSAAQIKVARDLFEGAVKRWQVYRSAAGRQLHVFQRPVPLDIIAAAEDAANILGLVKPKAKLPIVTSIIENLKKGPSKVDVVKLGKDIIDHFRLNLFSVSSWTLDMVGNASELGPQVAEAVGRDLVYTAKGKTSFPSLQGMFRAIRFRNELIPKEVQERLGTNTVSGEIVPGHVSGGPGTFTMREGVGAEGSLTRKVTKLGSTVYDYLVGGPLYAKNVVDTTAKRFGALSVIYRDAIVAADKAKVTGLERLSFIDDFTHNLPDATKEAAIRQGNKAGFNRELSAIEEKVAGSYTARLFVDVFARWPFQFSRWAGEMIGYNGGLLDDALAGKASLEDLGGYLAKTATGIGGLYLLNQALYDHVDFHSMEYVDEEGNRVRLSNRDPIPTGLFFLSLLHRDLDRAAASLQFASLPGAHMIAGQGGIFGNFLEVIRNTAQNPTGDPRQARRELEDMFNRAIPGQALLGALETIVDPAIREGIGANIPGYSSTLPAAINPTTGEPLRPSQKIRIKVGDTAVETPEFPTFSGVPIPGATRVIDPVHKLLARYGMLVYRGPRQPVAGMPASQIDPDMRREWLVAFGRYRQAYLYPLTQTQDLGGLDFEEARKLITHLDSIAAQSASQEISQRYGGPPRPGRQPSRFEKTGPPAYFDLPGGPPSP